MNRNKRAPGRRVPLSYFRQFVNVARNPATAPFLSLLTIKEKCGIYNTRLGYRLLWCFEVTHAVVDTGVH